MRLSVTFSEGGAGGAEAAILSGGCSRFGGWSTGIGLIVGATVFVTTVCDSLEPLATGALVELVLRTAGRGAANKFAAILVVPVVTEELAVELTELLEPVEAAEGAAGVVAAVIGEEIDEEALGVVAGWF